MKCYDKDMNVFLRFLERGGKAETFLTRKIFLPPLNFGCERMGNKSYFNNN